MGILAMGLCAVICRVRDSRHFRAIVRLLVSRTLILWTTATFPWVVQSFASRLSSYARCDIPVCGVWQEALWGSIQHVRFRASYSYTRRFGTESQKRHKGGK